MSIFTPFKFRYDLFRDGAPTRKTYGVSYSQQLSEAMRLFKLNQLEPYEYNDNHLSDPRLTLADKERFLSYNQACIMNSQLNPLPSRGVLQKFVFSQYLGSFGIPTPRNYGYFDPDFGYTPERESFRNPEDLKLVLDSNELSEFVIKPAGGAKGTGIHIITSRVGDKFTSGDDRQYDLKGILDLMLSHFERGLPHHREGVLLQERIVQHPQLAAIHPYCTNTLRVMTFLNSAGDVEILGCIIKFGRGKTMVDNVDKGALMCNIDEIGIIGPLVIISPSRLDYLTHHPDSGAPVAGVKLPFYSEAIERAREAQKRLPQLRTLGFDIAITSRGPVIIEGNAWWGILPQVIARRGFITDGVRAELKRIM
ncbi:MAG: sugar-transfer associated ATP-grasp domain-containing protein [Candidatus Zixiibacteriota bacterium]